MHKKTALSLKLVEVKAVFYAAYNSKKGMTALFDHLVTTVDKIGQFLTFEQSLG